MQHLPLTNLRIKELKITKLFAIYVILRLLFPTGSPKLIGMQTEDEF